MSDLSPGDVVYQSDQELFLVVIEEHEKSYRFAAHGWREIDKSRIEDYLEDSHSKVHSQSDIERIIEEKGNEQTKRHFNKLKQLFAVYEEMNVPDEGPHTDFVLDE